MTEALRAPEPGGVGVRTSDEIFALADPALDFFTQWADIWNAVAPSKIEPERDIRQKFHTGAGLDFGAFLADADILARGHATLSAAHADATAATTALFRAWQSPAATAAEAASPSADALLDHLDAAARLIPETVTHVFTTLKTKVDEVLRLRTETVAGADFRVAQRIVALSQGKAGSREDLLDLARWFDSAGLGNDLHSRLQDCDPVDVGYAARAAEQWLTGPFATEFHARYTAFQGLCATAGSTIDAQFRALTGFLPVESTVDEVIESPTPPLGLPVVPVELDSVSGFRSGSLDLPDEDEPTAASGTLDLPDDSGDPDDSTTAAASLSELGAHVIDPPQDQPSELGTAPGGDVTFDPLGPNPAAMPDGVLAFGPLSLPGLPTLGTAPGDPSRGAPRPVPDVFDTQGSVGRISGSLDEGPGR
ncbi:hypothetical protein VSH64_41205 [Amycolatopsis rhabdoformis]|uniref:WXG100 family type VII secretion target n=1 Tax=Amycolatopsis rhabdoformis TaxID=1448059 RepID=A0ABZ1I6L3_9PSEU|nr:hypothetical protein [Amycolatopsis rhabdoformis]WSE29168.1 hypothetical protein VSH64_41205 [Amycolatopsis rhabdoformis]